MIGLFANIMQHNKTITDTTQPSRVQSSLPAIVNHNDMETYADALESAAKSRSDSEGDLIVRTQRGGPEPRAGCHQRPLEARER